MSPSCHYLYGWMCQTDLEPTPPKLPMAMTPVQLEKALYKLLEPVKAKCESDVFWGDLVILAGTTAIESMGGPILRFCGGRIGDIDGSNSLILGQSGEQEELTPRVINGNCAGTILRKSWWSILQVSLSMTFVLTLANGHE